MKSFKDPKVVWIGTGFFACAFILAVFAVSYIREGMHPVSASVSSLGPKYWLASSVLREINVWSASESEPMQPYFQRADADEREVELTGSMWIFVDDPGSSRESIQESVQKIGGYVAGSSSSTTSSGAIAVEMDVRVPAKSLSTVLTEIRKQALRIESENFNTRDVTRDSADLAATLRNLHAEEAQYLLIMKRATSVKDVLQVSQALAGVREKIDKAQTQWNLLRHRVSMAALTVTLHPDADSNLAGLHWRPLRQLKIAFYGATQKLTIYLDSMTELAMALPIYILWLVSLALVLALILKILFWIAIRLFPGVRQWGARKETA